MNAHLQYLCYVLRYKYFVLLVCLRYRLLWQGLTHDWSKFLPSEWLPYVAFFYGPRPRGAKERSPAVVLAFDVAWNHHQKRQPHHWQYWLLHEDGGAIKALPIPDRYRKEMLADWRGAGLAQGKPNTLGWYAANRGKMILHSETRVWVERELGFTSAEGSNGA